MDAKKILYCNTPFGPLEEWVTIRDSSLFLIRADTLILIKLPERPPFNRGEEDSPDFMAGAYEILVRQGGGSGLPGRWRHQGASYHAKAGTPSDSTRARIELNNVLAERWADLEVKEWELASGEFRSGAKTFWAKIAMEWWEGRLTASGTRELDRYELQMKMLDEDRVEFTGLKSREKVIVHYHESTWIDYSSDNPSHAPYIWGSEPGKCPSTGHQEWFHLFLDANVKAIGEGEGGFPGI